MQASHGGSGAQARAVIDGLAADVVTLALAADIDAIAAKTGKIPADWQKRLPNNSAPYTSTIVFLVRKGNPKGIHDWDDLVEARRRRHHAQPEDLGRRALELSRRLGLRPRRSSAATRPRPRTSSRRSTRTCRCSTPARAARPSPSPSAGIGDVLIAWENDAFLASEEFGKDQFEIVAPSLSILAEPPVAVVDGNVDAKGTRKLAEAYLQFLYTPRGAGDHRQELLSPRAARKSPTKEDLARFPKIDLVTVDGDFGGWTKAQANFFADGGVFDQIVESRCSDARPIAIARRRSLKTPSALPGFAPDAAASRWSISR